MCCISKATQSRYQRFVDASVKVEDFKASLIDKALFLVLDVLIQYLEHHLTIKERDGIAMPGTALGLVPSSRCHG